MKYKIQEFKEREDIQKLDDSLSKDLDIKGKDVQLIQKYPKDIDQRNGVPVKIALLEKVLENLKKKGSTYIFIEPNQMMQGYSFFGVDHRDATADETLKIANIVKDYKELLDDLNKFEKKKLQCQDDLLEISEKLKVLE